MIKIKINISQIYILECFVLENNRDIHFDINND